MLVSFLSCTLQEWGGTPLYLAARGSHTDAVAVLLENGADINKADVRSRDATVCVLRLVPHALSL